MGISLYSMEKTLELDKNRIENETQDRAGCYERFDVKCIMSTTKCSEDNE